MDFTLTEEQRAIAELAGRILGERCSPEVLRTLEGGSAALAGDAWAALGAADLLGLSAPDDIGGSGLGLIEACLVAEQVGRHVAPVPYWPSTAAALTMARWGTEGQRDRWIPGALTGEAPLAVALWEVGNPGLGATPAVVARVGDDGQWRIEGQKQPVPWAGHATALLVPARTGEHTGLFIVESDAEGVVVTDEALVNRESCATVSLDGARGALVGGLEDAAHLVAWLAERTAALLCATTLGVCEGALRLTATHVAQRQQFGAPIGTFQAVAHRCADAYIDTEAIRLTAWQAAWRLDAGIGPEDALAIAAFWATEGAQRVVHAAQHLHGGIGVDVDYPLHRYFRWAKVLELLLGGATSALLRLGASIASGETTTT